MGCDRHPYDPAAASCRKCGAAFCAECLVWVDGEDRPPTCLRCALAGRLASRTSRRPQVPARA